MIIWASSWDYGTYHIGDQRRLWRDTHEVWKLTKGPTKYQTSSPTGWLRMRVWRIRLRRTKSTIISWAGSLVARKSHRICICQTLFYWIGSYMDRLVTKPTKWHMGTSKTQISLGIRPDWSESSLSARRKLGSLATHWAQSEDTDQTGLMPSLIWVFAGRTVILLVLSWGGSYDETVFSPPTDLSVELYIHKPLLHSLISVLLRLYLTYAIKKPIKVQFLCFFHLSTKSSCNSSIN